MALVVMVEATVTYACRLSEEDEQKIRKYSEDNYLDIEDAIMEMYDAGKIELYENSTESDFYTNCITEVYGEEE